MKSRYYKKENAFMLNIDLEIKIVNYFFYTYF